MTYRERVGAPSATILGAGIQGVCCALALARQGYRVHLVDQAPAAMLRTSLAGEGKIHLGFVYAKDATLATARLMLEAATRFAPLLESWLEQPIEWPAFSSRPFAYGIMHDSMVTPAALQESYHALQAMWDDLRQDGRTGCTDRTYLGRHPARLWSPSAQPPGGNHIADGHVAQWIETAEVALHTATLRATLLAALDACPAIAAHYEHRVEEVTRTPHGFRTTLRRDAGTSGASTSGADTSTPPVTLDADIVVNCLWAGRLAIDAQLGIAPPRPWNYRLKYSLRAAGHSLPTDLPSMTLVLGSYGDLVYWPRQNSVYLSWYPACLQGWSDALNPPPEMLAAAAGDADPAQKRAIAESTVRALAAIVPGLEKLPIAAVAAGIIFAWGNSDIDDPTSQLHQRAQIGVAAHDGYFSINTGKLTTAPLFAQQLLDHLAGRVAPVASNSTASNSTAAVTPATLPATR